MFHYQFFSSFNGTYLYDYSFLMLMALVFTRCVGARWARADRRSLPVFVMGAFDQDVSAPHSLRHPQLYRRGVKQEGFTRVSVAPRSVSR